MIRDRRVAGYIERIGEIAAVIAANAGRSEREARLAPETVDALHDAGLFRILLPERLGGGDLTIPESARVYEAVARIDGSAGWNLGICAGGPLFGHFVSPEAYEEIFADPRVAIAGSLNPMTMRAEPVDGGYRYSGTATYLSGSSLASWVAVSGLILSDGSPTFVDGIPLVRSALIPMRHFKSLDNWSVAGMSGTGSSDATCENVFVSENFTYAWPDPKTTWKEGAYAAIPLVTQLGGTLAAVAVGVAQHSIDALYTLAGHKVPTGTRNTLRERPIAQIQLAQAEGLVGAARAYLHQMLDDIWAAGESRELFDPLRRARARLASVTAARLSAQAVDLIHDAAGATSIQRSAAFERCWRDVHTITQHVILSTARFEIVGRVLLGLDPGIPII